MKKYIILSIAIFILNSCKKATETTYTIKGKFVKCTNGIETAMLPNEPIDLFQKNNGSNNNSKVIANTITNADGTFIFTYSSIHSQDKLLIRASSGFGFVSYIEGLPLLQDIPNLKIQTFSQYNLAVNLNVVKPYTNADTLFYGRPDIGTDIKIAGPFVTGRLFKIINAPLRSTLYYESNTEYIPFRINDPFGQFTRKEFTVNNSNLCGSDTVFVNIDVR